MAAWFYAQLIHHVTTACMQPTRHPFTQCRIKGVSGAAARGPRPQIVRVENL